MLSKNDLRHTERWQRYVASGGVDDVSKEPLELLDEVVGFRNADLVEELEAGLARPELELDEWRLRARDYWGKKYDAQWFRAYRERRP